MSTIDRQKVDRAIFEKMMREQITFLDRKRYIYFGRDIIDTQTGCIYSYHLIKSTWGIHRSLFSLKKHVIEYWDVVRWVSHSLSLKLIDMFDPKKMGQLIRYENIQQFISPHILLSGMTKQLNKELMLSPALGTFNQHINPWGFRATTVSTDTSISIVIGHI